MKKMAVLAGVAGALLVVGTSSADFKDSLEKELQQEIGAFYQRNEGSKITIDIMDGLMLHINQILGKNKIKKEETPVVKPEKPVVE